MTAYNVWLPGNKIYTYNQGATRVVGTLPQRVGGSIVAETFTIPNGDSGFGFTFDMPFPPFNITKPPKVAYSSTADFMLGIKDSAGWMWMAPCPKQATIAERGWAWSQFTLAAVQDPAQTGTPPTVPATGAVLLFQFQGADSITYPAGINIAYVAGRTPGVAPDTGTIRKLSLLVKDDQAYQFKVGDVSVVNGTRRPIIGYGSLPFGLTLNGPSRNALSSAPYRGPYESGYQSGTPHLDVGDAASETYLNNQADLMLQAQAEFTARHPTKLVGPWMHCFLPAVWDSEQSGTLDSWVWDAPDGNPAWPGWQYRAFDAMARTWAMAVVKGSTSASKFGSTASLFLTWVFNWMQAHPDANYVPSSWGPPGWSQGIPLPPNSYLDPQGTAQEPHDLALVAKGAIWAAQAGGDLAKCRYVFRRCLRALQTIQVRNLTTHTVKSPMRGAFSVNPSGFIAYGFQQGEVLESLAAAAGTDKLLT